MAYAGGVESDKRSVRSWLAMAWKRTPRFPPYRPDPQPLAPFEQALEEGLLIARHGVTLAVKNRLIVRALQEDARFDDEESARIVAEELALAAEEQRENAQMMVDARATTDLSGGLPDHAHHYHLIDASTLRRRQRLYVALAESLEEARENPDSVAEYVERARAAAWQDIGKNVTARLEQRLHSFADDPDYILDRQDRLRQLLEVDLPALERRDDRPV